MIEEKPVLKYGVMQYELRHQGEELIGFWQSDLVPEDYDMITIRQDHNDLLINTGESTLWLRFEKEQRNNPSDV